MINIPNDLILFLSGTSCVGKTSVAHYLLKIFPNFRNVTEMDIIRTTARAIVKEVTYSHSNMTEKLSLQKYETLFASTKVGDYNNYKQQAAFFINSVREIVRRQQSRKIPTIIEGINIVPSLYFVDGQPIEDFQNHILFINLYLSNENEHIERRTIRCKERCYSDSVDKILDTVKKIRDLKNENLHLDCTLLSHLTNNVFSIDTAGKSIETVAKQILRIVEEHFTS